VMAVDGRVLWELLDQVKPNNAKGEYYLTDLVGLARGRGLSCGAIEAAADEVVGVNSRVELAEVEGLFQARKRREAMLAGATLADPSSVWFSHDTVLGKDVTVGPCVVFGPGVVVGDHVTIKGFCHLEGARIEAGAQVGPYARLRPGAAIGAEAHIGNFVEVKQAVIEAGAKVNHLSYVGDAHVGAKANVGAGTITCNYDGFTKAVTEIGAGAFIGSNTALVAPVKVGAGAMVAAGSVIVADVAPDALAVARGKQEQKAGWASRFRSRRAAAKLKSKRG
jgi:bifunctional UDP-N-acetylglucosamine pyrophosphorylase/glucosamine-1-phosphate N-acetyltransferase